MIFTPTNDPAEIQRRRDFLRSLYETFSDTGKLYRSLNKTLAAFPSGIPPEHIGLIKMVHLQRPMTDSLELQALLCAVGLCKIMKIEIPEIWHRAKRAEIIRAMVCPASQHGMRCV